MKHRFESALCGICIHLKYWTLRGWIFCISKPSCCLLSCLKGAFWLEHSVVCSTGCSHEKVRLFTVRFIREWGLRGCISKASRSCWRTTASGWIHQSKMSPSCPLVTSLQGCVQNGDEKVCNWMWCLCFLKQLWCCQQEEVVTCRTMLWECSRDKYLLSSYRLPQSGGHMIDPYDIPNPPIPHAPNPPPVNPPPYPGLRGKKKKVKFVKGIWHYEEVRREREDWKVFQRTELALCAQGGWVSRVRGAGNVLKPLFSSVTVSDEPDVSFLRAEREVVRHPIILHF